MDWIQDYEDKDGDGFVEYARLNDRGLINQGWKDSWDGINFADGTLLPNGESYRHTNVARTRKH
ncbi:glycogen debranching enzyme [Arthrobacter sp. BE255]|nr:glycogen debranching enzyme [Arthrobacter sp. BE255]